MSGSAEPSKRVNVRLILPLPPGVNNMYVTVGKRRVLSKTAKAFRKEASAHIENLRVNGKISRETQLALGRELIGVYCTFYFETPMRRDLDGGLKITLDALAADLGFDDRAVVDLHLTKQIDPLHPRLEVEIETIHDWTFDQSYVYLGEPAVDPESADSIQEADF